MADKKISELTNITGANLADNDEFVVVDISADETKAVTRAEFFKSIPAISGTTGTFSGDLTVGGNVVATGSVRSSGLIGEGDATAPHFSFSSDTDTGMFRVGVDTLGFSTNAAEHMRITNVGRVGIGTSTPAAKLHVSESSSSVTPNAVADTLFLEHGTDVGITLATSATGECRIAFADTDDDIAGGIEYDHATDDFIFLGKGNTSELMRITSAGNVGIGTTSPASIVGGTDTSPVLSIGGADSVLVVGDKSGSLSFITNDGSYTGTYADGVTSEIASVSESGVGGAYGMSFYTGTTSGSNRGERMRITSTGNVGIGTSSPNAASIVDAQSTTKGVRFPNMTTTQKNAIANVAGNVVFDTTLGKLCVNSGSGWETITSV